MSYHLTGGGERSVALTAGENCITLKDPEKHRPAKENNITASFMIFDLL